ncbi:nuclear transport factor 2 family protein [Tardibacter chloracetimidivorans]|nr:nuclear transport factor 2 family protein [Tardibacter chloracetimidivorans]
MREKIQNPLIYPSLSADMGAKAFIRTMSNIENIKLLKARYCRFLDQQMWDDFVELFTPGCMFAVEVKDPAQWSIFRKEGSNPEPISRDLWIAMVSRTMADGGMSAHHVHSPEISFVDDSNAIGFWALEDHLLTPAMKFHGWGRYEHRLIRIGSAWKIAAWRLRWMHIEAI